MPLTLKDIARMAGVAESTVSRAINNKPGVSLKTRQKILQIVRENNFVPNKLAQGLAKKETHLLALLIPDLSNRHYPRIIKSIEEIVGQNSFQLILCNTNNNLEQEKYYLDLLERNQIDGAIIVGGEPADEHIIRAALRKDNPIVLINRLVEEVLLPTVLVDSRRGGFLAAEHLISQGLDRIAIIMGSAQEYLESEKLSGYREALQENGLDYDPRLVLETDGSREEGFKSFLKLMNLQHPPRGFFVTSDLLAVGLVEAVKMGGYFIPEDFLLASYGESILTSIMEPALTTVAEPLEQLGEEAAKFLIKLITGPHPDELIRVLEPVLKVRDSTKSAYKKRY